MCKILCEIVVHRFIYSNPTAKRYDLLCFFLHPIAVDKKCILVHYQTTCLLHLLDDTNVRWLTRRFI